MWLPDGFQAPESVEIADTGFHLRQIGPADTELDMVAVMGSQERLWSIFGEAWGWPPADMTAEQDRVDLKRHAEEMRRNESFNYALFDSDETMLVGCVYIDPPERVGADADISWWVTDAFVDTGLDEAVARFVPVWIANSWPFAHPRHIGVDLSWAEWLSLPSWSR
jgi:Acetyltransferase (GNAT) domain